MLRIWGESQQLLIEPNAFSVSSAGVPRRIAFEESPEDALMGGWNASGEAIRRGSNCQVVLADALVRYLVIRWPAGLRGSSERLALVTHRFREVHAVTSPEWQIKVERSIAGIPVLACAVPTKLLESVAKWARGTRTRLVGVTGEFVAVYNRMQRRFTHPLGALAVRRDARVTFGLWRDATWQTVCSQPCGGRYDSGSGIMLDLLGAQLKESDGRGQGVLYCVGGMHEPPAGWQVLSLDEER